MMSKFDKSVYEFIECRSGVTCTELADNFGKGNFGLISKNKSVPCKLVQVFGISEELWLVITNLLANKDIIFIPCDPDVYLKDGSVMTLPIAYDQIYFEPSEIYWVPTLIYTKEQAVEFVKEKFANDEERRDEILNFYEQKF